MDLSWILLALFLVALIWGMSKSLTRSVVKNAMRLGTVVVAFLITFGLQLGGVLQNAITTVVDIFDIGSLLPGFEGAVDLINGLASTVVSPILFGLVFFIILVVLRIIVHFVAGAVDKAISKKAEPATESTPVEETPAVEEAPAVEAVEEAPVEETATEESAEEAAEEKAEGEATESAECDAPADEVVVEAAEEATVEEAPAEEPAKAEEAPAQPEKPVKAKKEKKKKKGLYPECAWKRAISIATGAISGLLILAVFLMPIFYIMSLAGTATGAIDGSDADDSQIYQIVDIVDEYVVDPYEGGFVASFYKALGLSDLMNFTTKAGGKLTLSDGSVVYADDVLKGIISHGVSAAAQITSAKSECEDVKGDVNAIINDPVVSSILADVVMTLIADLELDPAAEEDLMAGLIENFVEHYKNADKATIEKDLSALGSAVGVLAEERILAALISGNVDLEVMLEDEETLGDVVEAISGLSAFGPTIEGAFVLGIDILGETLMIPADDAEAYEIFMEDLLDRMVKSENVKYNANTIKGYVTTVVARGGRTSSSIAGHSMFLSYVSHWQKVQSAFANASEDKSYGYFTIEINGKWYVYNSKDGVIVEYNSDTEAAYKDKISPVAGIINALTLKSTTSRLTRDNLYTILNAYVASATDEVSLEVANRILDKENFVSHAVTVEKLQASTNFTDWTDEEKATDSRLCVSIIMDLLGLMDKMSNLGSSEGNEAVLDFVDQFEVLGKTMDTMSQTSCINQLPPLLIEGLVKNEMLSTFMKPSIAFQINNIVENTDNSYVDCMIQIADKIEWAITLGGDIQ